jgi:beta-N-acetylhexosaminidase
LKSRRLFVAIWIILLLVGAVCPAYPAEAARLQQTVDPAQKVRTVLLKMTPEEKVGQLFLVTFKGRDLTSKDSKILDMIANRLLGGILLDGNNDNFTGPTGTVEDANRLTRELQTARWNASQVPATNPITRQQFTPQYIPLFIGISQEGDSAPYDQIINGVTVLPSEMALGATWKTKLAEKTGAVMGTELQALGINLLLGPSLDVQDSAVNNGGEDLGTRVFSGSPYWVGEMGKAFIRGLHEGSSRTLAVITTHFPGRGNSDRSPEEEVATVKKSLDQLKLDELVPFISTAGTPGTDGSSDGVLVSHIRYQGLQGNIRSTTRPISFDQAALDIALSFPALSAWRQGGGILVSDNLGSPSIRKFYDPTGTSFDARQVARNAFLAGNDVLILDNFVASGDVDAYITLQRTLELFAQKYREDPAFAQRVDASVTRILTLKFRMYPEFSLNNVLPTPSDLAQVGQAQQVSFEVASQAVTLVGPTAAELSQILPRAPELRDRLFFITDTQVARQCSQCPQQYILAVDALKSAVARLYGPRAGGQVQATNLYSYAFADLKAVLDNTKDQPPKLEEELKQAEWVVMAVTNLQPGQPQTVALKKLLSDREDLIRNKKVILFAFGAPVYLDATDISKLTAYFALYGKSASFVEVAARVLFQELAPAGALPVTVAGAGYDLNLILSPDPTQVIQLDVDQPAQLPTPQPTATGRPTTTVTPPAVVSITPTSPPVRLKVGDTLPLRTGIILDHNKNPVQDGTGVRFLFTLGSGEGSTQSQIEAVTVQGVARASFRIPNSGVLEIRVVSEPAISSKLLRLEISSSGQVAITAVTPTSPPTVTSTVTPTATPTVTPTVTPTLTPPPPPIRSGTGDWSISLVLIWGLAGLAFLGGRKFGDLRWAIRWAFLVVAGGWIAYLLVTLKLPGAQDWLEQYGKNGIPIAALVGCVSGLLVAVGWKVWMTRRAQMVRPKRVKG